MSWRPEARKSWYSLTARESDHVAMFNSVTTGPLDSSDISENAEIGASAAASVAKEKMM